MFLMLRICLTAPFDLVLFSLVLFFFFLLYSLMYERALTLTVVVL